MQDARIINVALEGIENILKLGEDDRERAGADMNDFSRLVEEAEGMDKLEALQGHQNEEIYERAMKILENYFGIEEEEVTAIEPGVAADGSGFTFGAPEGGGGFAGFNGQMQS